MVDPAIRLLGVKIDYVLKSRQRLRVLNGLNLDIKPGEFVSIVGPSGCGKTTLLRAVAGLVAPVEGGISVTGGGGPFPLSMVFQRPNLLPWLTVRQNAELPFRVSGDLLTESAHTRINGLLATVGLFGFQDAFPNELSGGMQMRASLVRALVTNPDVVLMDEPFGALDEATRDRLGAETLDIWTRRSCTIVFVTHNIREAVYLADRVVLLSRRPARVVLDCPVPLGRPRTPEMRQRPEFNAVVEQLLSGVRHD